MRWKGFSLFAAVGLLTAMACFAAEGTKEGEKNNVFPVEYYKNAILIVVITGHPVDDDYITVGGERVGVYVVCDGGGMECANFTVYDDNTVRVVVCEQGNFHEYNLKTAIYTKHPLPPIPGTPCEDGQCIEHDFEGTPID